MKEVKFNVFCNAVYNGVLEVEGETEEEILEEILNRLNEVSVTDLEWVSDWETDAVTIDDIYSIEEV